MQNDSATKFRVSALSLAVIATSLTSTASYAQNDVSAKSKGSELEEVVVTGIRASLKSAQALRLGADVLVDAIVAEDIGKLPDNNIAEALQRIPGIQIDRSTTIVAALGGESIVTAGGEGTSVAVRGLSSDLNRAELNDVSFAGTSVSRGADFRNIPSDFISRVEVVKTPSASMTEGAIGGWVKSYTRRPFDGDGGLQLLGSVGGRYVPAADTSETDDFSPEFNVFASNTWGETIGGSFMYHRSQIDNRSDVVEDILSTFTDVDGDGTGEFIAQVPRYFQSLQSEKRESFSAALQYRPTEDFELIADITRSERENDFNDLLVGTNQVADTQDNSAGNLTDFEREGNTISGYTIGTLDYRALSAAFTEERETTTYSFDANWQISDMWRVRGILGVSEGTFDNPRVNFFADALIDGPVRYFHGGKNNDWLTDLDFTTVGQSGEEFQTITAGYSQQKVDQEEQLVQLDFEVDLDWGVIGSIEFGAQYRSTEFDSIGAGGPGNGDVTLSIADKEALFTDDSGVIDTVALERFNDQLLISLPGEFGEFYKDDPGVPGFFHILNADLVRDTLLTPAQQRALANYAPEVTNYGRVYHIEEEITGAYVQGNIEINIGDMPLTGNIGIRAVKTKTSTSGFQNADPTLPIEFDSEYTNILPSLNLKLEVSDQLTARFALSRVLARPAIGALAPSFNFNVVSFTGSSGNAELDPFEADQLDLSLDYDLNDYTALTAAYYYKDVKNFTDNVTTPVDLFGDGRIFAFSVPQNAGEATIQGLELSASHDFMYLGAPWDGFGLMANITFVDSGSIRKNAITGESLPFPGLSDLTYNIIGYYEKGNFSTRIAYNFRDENLYRNTGLGAGGQLAPSIREGYGSLDASVSYDITEYLSVYMAGVNLTNSYDRTFREGGANVSDGVTSFGRRYEFGIRAKF